jgi:hypothetical protein
MNITTTRIEPNERARDDDFEFAFQSIIKNTAALDRLFNSLSTDYVIGGTVRAIKGKMTITVDPLWANGKDIVLPAYQDTISLPIGLTVPRNYPRYSIIQVRGKLQSFDPQTRSFYNSEIKMEEFHDIDTKNKLVTDIVVKHSNEGVDHSPETDQGFVKIAEIYLEPDTTEITEDNIKNVTSRHDGGENDWTNEKDKTFNAGYQTDIIAKYFQEHNKEGNHRDQVITTSNIKDESITNTKMAGNSVETINIKDKNVTQTKIEDIATDSTATEATFTAEKVTFAGFLKKVWQGITWLNTVRTNGLTLVASEDEKTDGSTDGMITVQPTGKMKVNGWDKVEQRIIGEYRYFAVEPSAYDLAKNRLLPLKAQPLPIALYQELFDKKYKGQDADWWYKCNSSGAKDINGEYFIPEDSRGLFHRIAGINSIYKGANDTPYDGKLPGEFISDAMRDLKGELGYNSNRLFHIANGVFEGIPTTDSLGVAVGDNVLTNFCRVNFKPSLQVSVAYENRPASMSVLVYMSY